MLKAQFHVAVPTAFHLDESLNVEATVKHVQNLARRGVTSVLIVGSTGEQHSMTAAEKSRLAQGFEQAQLPAGFELIVGVANIRQQAALAQARALATMPWVSAILVGMPPYVLPTQAEACQYFQAITAAAQKPAIIYNNPHRTGFDLSRQSVLTLLKDPQVIGIKEAGSIEQVRELCALLPADRRDLAIYGGGENHLVDRVAAGYNRLSSMWGNLYPEAISAWFADLLTAKDVATPAVVNQALATAPTTSFLPHLKQAISDAEGIDMGICRSPLGN